MSEIYQPLPIAACDAAAIDAVSRDLAAWLERSPDIELPALGQRLTGAPLLEPHRRVLFARNRAEAIVVLRSAPPKTSVSGVAEWSEPQIGFLFPGPSNELGLEEIYTSVPVFEHHFNACADIIRRTHDFDPRPLLARTSDSNDTRILSFLFAVEYALAATWDHWGVRPSVLMGYSFGEIVAACVGGVLGLEDAVTVACHRSRLLDSLPRGAMTSVALPESRVRPLLNEGVGIAIHRSPTSCVVSGSTEAVSRFESTLDEAGVRYQRLTVPFSGHSPQVESILPAFTQFAEQTRRRPPSVPIVSNVTGRMLTAAQATSAGYWSEQLRHTVQFATGLQVMVEAGCRIILEVGPGHHLTSLSSQQLPRSSAVVALPTLRTVVGNPSTRLGLLRTAARLWTLGVKVDWQRFY